MKWEEPVPSRRGTSSRNWREIARELKANPGKWALVGEGEPNGSTVTRIKKGLFAGMDEGDFYATSRKQEDGTFKIYAQFTKKTRRR